MKKKKGLIGALLILVVLLGVYFLLKSMNLEEEQEEETTTETVFEVQEEEISALTVETEGNTYSFAQKEETWTYTDQENFPLDTDLLETKIGAITSVISTRIIENPESVEDYGVEDPAVRITITTTDDKTQTLEIGNENSAVSGCYLTVNGETDKIYLVDAQLKSDFQFDIKDLAEQESIPSITGSTVKKVTIEREDGIQTLGEDSGSETGWLYTEKDGTQTAAGSSQVQEYLSQFSSLSWSGFESADPEDLETYGLNQPVKVTVDYEETETVEDEESEEETTETVEKQAVLLLGSQNEEGDYYAKMQDHQYVYLLSSSAAEGILGINREQFLDTKVADYSFADMDKVTFVRNGISYEATKETKEVESEEEEETQTETSYLINGKEVDMGTFSEFYSMVNALEWQSQAADAQAQGEPEFSVTFEKEGGIQVTTDYYVYDSNFYLVVDTKGNQVLVNKMKVKEILDAFDELIAGMEEE